MIDLALTGVKHQTLMRALKSASLSVCISYLQELQMHTEFLKKLLCAVFFRSLKILFRKNQNPTNFDVVARIFNLLMSNLVVPLTQCSLLHNKFD